MLVRFLSCRERFRLKYVLGLEPMDKWNHRMGYGNMWHACEEALAKYPDYLKPCMLAGSTCTANVPAWCPALTKHTDEQLTKYPLQRDEIGKWYRVCLVQFPEYAKHWSEHPDVKNRTPLLQEQIFDVPYALPSGRVARLRGKWDSVDLITEETEGLIGRHRQTTQGIYLQENKTKGDIDKLQVERQLKFDLQTMMYLVALELAPNLPQDTRVQKVGYFIRGVRYNVVRRPLSGGIGNIKPHAMRTTKTKVTPAETAEEFYERLRRDYIAADPGYWFFRVRAEISERDIEVFRRTCLDPLLEQVCWWYDDVTNGWDKTVSKLGSVDPPPMNYRTPFGVYSALEEGGSTEYDAYLDNGSEAGLRRTEELFPELK